MACSRRTSCSVSIAVDAATKENGCLQVLKGSHGMGRVDHILSGDQAGADMERVREAMKRYQLVDCVMQPGDALFFHANLLHASARNDSDKPRWSMICCYNAKKNDPYKEAHHPRYTPLKKVPDAMIKKAGIKRFSEDRAKVVFLDVQKDSSAVSWGSKSGGDARLLFVGPGDPEGSAGAGARDSGHQSSVRKGWEGKPSWLKRLAQVNRSLQA